MTLPYRSLFRYGDNIALFMQLPITPWTRSTGVVGGDIEADSGARAAYVVRRDEFLRFTLRFFEDEWPYVQMLIDYGQTGQLFVWYPDQDDLTTNFTCYLDVPSVGEAYQVSADGQYPRVFHQDITLVRPSWNIASWNVPDEDIPAGPTGWVIHYFTHGGGTFTVLAGSGDAEILIIGGGGSGGSVDGTGVGAGGGGAGGVVHLVDEPLGVGSYPVQAGTGASAPHTDHMIGIGSAIGNNGGESFFGDYAAQGGGGGGGGKADYPQRVGKDGASGGGGASATDPFGDPPPNNWSGGFAIYGPQGNDGGSGLAADDSMGAGGGGAGGGGSLGVGGVGLDFDIASVDGTFLTYASGGGAKMGAPVQATGYGDGGGGGHGPFCDGGIGGGGIVIVKYTIESGIIAVGGIRVEFPD